MKTILISLLLLISTFTFSQCTDTIISPNAFTPTLNSNPEFYPTYINNYTNYDLAIYNRWGNLIFIGDKWDGSYKGTVCEKGIYLYEIKVYGQECTKVFYGTVTLIR